MWIFFLAIVLLALLIAVTNIFVVQQSKAYVIERLGAFHAVQGVGLHFKVPFIDRIARRVSLKEQVLDYPPSPSSPRTTLPCRSTLLSTSRSPTPSSMPTVWSIP